MLSTPLEGSQRTILIAEDEEMLRAVLQRTLSRAGEKYKLIIAVDAEQAFTMSDDYPGEIDLLISNVSMPGMPGPELARELKYSRPGMQVMLISGYDKTEVDIEPDWHFLQKPFLPKALIDKVESVFQESQPAITHVAGGS